jgi:hypothetical protein
MTTLKLMIGLGSLALAAYFIADTYRRYRAASGAIWDRLLSSAKDSATMLMTKLSVVLAAIVANIGDAADFVGLPSIREYAEKLLASPKSVAVTMLAMALIIAIARKRTL